MLGSLEPQQPKSSTTLKQQTTNNKQQTTNNKQQTTNSRTPTEAHHHKQKTNPNKKNHLPTSGLSPPASYKTHKAAKVVLSWVASKP